MTDHKAIGIIPARGGSKRIPRKNIVDINGKPMIAYTILSANKSILGKDVYVSTEDSQIAKISEKYDAKVIKRPRELAQDTSATLPVLQHVVDVLEKQGLVFDTVVLLQPTSPFRNVETIDKGIKKLWDNWDKLDAVFTVKPTKFPPLWMLRIKKDILEFLYPNDFSKIRGQDLEKTYEIDGVLYVLKKDLVKKSENYPFAYGRTGYLITGKIESIDIDDMDDLEIARAVAKVIKV